MNDFYVVMSNNNLQFKRSVSSHVFPFIKPKMISAYANINKLQVGSKISSH